MKKKKLENIIASLHEQLRFLSYENKRMADFILKIGYTREAITDVIIGGYDKQIEDLEKPLTMVKLENQMLRKTLYSQEEEIRDLTTLLSDAKEKVNQLNKALHFKEVYDERI